MVSEHLFWILLFTSHSFIIIRPQKFNVIRQWDELPSQTFISFDPDMQMLQAHIHWQWRQQKWIECILGLELMWPLKAHHIEYYRQKTRPIEIKLKSTTTDKRSRLGKYYNLIELVYEEAPHATHNQRLSPIHWLTV
jgi:hypothetical protein